MPSPHELISFATSLIKFVQQVSVSKNRHSICFGHTAVSISFDSCNFYLDWFNINRIGNRRMDANIHQMEVPLFNRIDFPTTHSIPRNLRYQPDES
jgi:hypothetical protein